MVLLDLIPLSKPVAISEILLLMIGTTVIGWLIGRWVNQGRAQSLRERLLVYRTNLDDCRSESLRGLNTNATNLAEFGKDNLKLVEGIGPKVEELLNNAGISTFSQLAQADSGHLETILRNAGSRYQIHDPTSWPQQSALARDGRWEELKALQNRLDGGRVV